MHPEVAHRLPVWRALSELFLDTEIQDADIARIAQVLAESPYEISKLEQIYHHEIAPLLGRNLWSPTGEWRGFDDEWLVEKLEPKIDRRRWWYAFFPQPARSEWHRVWARVAALRQGSPAD
jgi:hypothetical protein